MLAVVALGMSFGTNDLTQACAVLSMFPGAAFMCTQADDFWRPFRKSQYIFVHFFYHLKHKKSSMVVDENLTRIIPYKG